MTPPDAAVTEDAPPDASGSPDADVGDGDVAAGSSPEPDAHAETEAESEPDAHAETEAGPEPDAHAESGPGATADSSTPGGDSGTINLGELRATIAPLIASVAGMVLGPIKGAWAALRAFLGGVPQMARSGAVSAGKASTGALVETRNAWVDLGRKIGAPIAKGVASGVGTLDGLLDKFGVAHPVRRLMGLGVLAALCAALLAPVGSAARNAELQAQAMAADAVVEAAGAEATEQSLRLAEIERQVDVLLSRKAHGEVLAGPTTTAPAAPEAAKPAGGGGAAPTTAAPSFLAAAPADGWSYDGATGPARWAALNPAWAACGDPVLQSPINIEAPQARPRQLPPATKPSKPKAARLVNYGRYLSLQFAGSTATIDGQSATLTEVRLHTPSEHRLEGRQYPGELQFLFDTGGGVSAAWAVLLDPAKPSAAFGEAFGEIPPNGQSSDRAKVDPAELLPEESKVFRYTGSLTTPGCASGVSWAVFEAPGGASAAALSAAQAATGANARPVQPSEGAALVSDTLFR